MLFQCTVHFKNFQKLLNRYLWGFDCELLRLDTFSGQIYKCYFFELDALTLNSCPVCHLLWVNKPMKNINPKCSYLHRPWKDSWRHSLLNCNMARSVWALAGEDVAILQQEQPLTVHIIRCWSCHPILQQEQPLTVHITRCWSCHPILQQEQPLTVHIIRCWSCHPDSSTGATITGLGRRRRQNGSSVRFSVTRSTSIG
jgi:hypothetical protein